METPERKGQVVSLDAAARGRMARGGSGDHVVVVEPVASEASLLEQLLTRSGRRVSRAGDDEVGLDLVLDQAPQLVIVSHGVPGGARAFIQTVQVMYAGKEGLPDFVVLLPAGGVAPDYSDLARLAIRTLRKPVHPEAFMRAVVRTEASDALTLPPSLDEPLGPSAIDQLRPYEDPDVIKELILATLSDIEQTLMDLEAQLFQPDPAEFRRLVHSIYGLGMNIGTTDLARACKAFLERPPGDTVEVYRSTLSGLRRLFARAVRDQD